MKTLTNLISPFSTKTLHTDTYEVVENESLTNENYSRLVVSGSLFSLTLFKKVSFDSCVFFASKFENCEFVACNFLDCTIQFSTFINCSFVGCKFKNVTWDLSHIRKSCLEDCFIDAKTSYFLMREDNMVKNCFTNRKLTWEELEKTEIIDMDQELTRIRQAS